MLIREDILTPKERMMALLTGKPLDRVICMPIVTTNLAQLIGKTVKEFQLDEENPVDYPTLARHSILVGEIFTLRLVKKGK